MITANIHDVTGLELRKLVKCDHDGMIYHRRDVRIKVDGRWLELTLYADLPASILLPGEKAPEPEKEAGAASEGQESAFQTCQREGIPF